MSNLDSQSPQAILRWAVRRYAPRLAVSVSFGGPGGMALIHMLSEIDRSVPVLFIDTGYLFPETLAFKDEVVARYGLNVRTLTPLREVGPLYETDTNGCCAARRVEPLDHVLDEYDAWVSAVRQDQSSTRADTQIIEQHDHKGKSVAKIYPLAHWRRADVMAYLQEYNVPFHPLLEHGYTSIGCRPCTQPNSDPSNERAGRWAGQGKTECGLHTFTTQVSSNE